MDNCSAPLTVKKRKTVCGNVNEYRNVKKLNTRFYNAQRYNQTHLTLSCLTNYHLTSGDLVLTCHNGSWIGQEPRCRLDKFKDKMTLSIIIITFSFIIPVLLLMVDFHFWRKKRNVLRGIIRLSSNDFSNMEGKPIQRTRMLYPYHGKHTTEFLSNFWAQDSPPTPVLSSFSLMEEDLNRSYMMPRRACRHRTSKELHHPVIRGNILQFYDILGRAIIRNITGSEGHRSVKRSNQK